MNVSFMLYCLMLDLININFVLIYIKAMNANDEISTEGHVITPPQMSSNMVKI